MTANTLITNLSNTTLVGMKIADLTIQANKDTLLSLVNLAKNKIAEDTLMWLSGETLTMTTASEYTLANMPIQIIDVFDEDNVLRERNSSATTGYYQTSPQTIIFNRVDEGKEVKVNYYETPPDYTIDDNITVPMSLLSALGYYVTARAFEQYKSDIDVVVSEKYDAKYFKAIGDYINRTDSLNADTVVGGFNKIWKRGIK